MSQSKVNTFLNRLGERPVYRNLFATAYQMMQIQSAFRRAVPPYLAEHCLIEKYSDRILVISADNSAVAAKLRQIVPTLLKKLDAQIDSIQIVVRVSYSKSPKDIVTGKRPFLSQTAANNLSQLALNLPESSLKSAIDSLLRNCMVISNSPSSRIAHLAQKNNEQ